MENGKASATYIIGRYIEKERVMEVRWGREGTRKSSEPCYETGCVVDSTL